jgi:periplasmic divalent cation tolerance protein
MEEKDCRWAFTTFPIDQKNKATLFIKKALQMRLVACAHIFPQIESHFVWENAITSAQEILISLKTSVQLSSSLHQLLIQHHPYACPQWILIQPQQISPTFFHWWRSTLITSPPSLP